MCLQIENLEKNTLGSWLVNTHTKNTSRGSTGSFVLFMVKRKRLSSACWIQLGFILLKCWDKDSPRHRGNQGHVKRPLIVLGFKKLELYSHWMPYGTENCDKLSTSQMGWEPGRPIGEQVFFFPPIFPSIFQKLLFWHWKAAPCSASGHYYFQNQLLSYWSCQDVATQHCAKMIIFNQVQRLADCSAARCSALALW